MTTTEAVHHPSHYQTAAGIEAIDVIRYYGFHRSFELGSALKYLLRAGRKGGPETLVTDLRKAQWYMDAWAGESEVDIEVPVAEPGALAWAQPEQILAAFELTGARAEAVKQLLAFAITDVAAGPQTVFRCFDLAQHAIAKAIQEAQAE